MLSVAEIRSAMILLWTKRNIAIAIRPRIAVAMIISSRVKAWRLRLRIAKDVELHLAALIDAAPSPFCRQGDQVDSAQLRVVFALEPGRGRLLHQHDVAIPRRDFRFFFSIGKTWGGLNFRHPVG